MSTVEGNSMIAGVSLELDISIKEFEINVRDGGLVSGGGCGGILVIVGVWSFKVVNVVDCLSMVSLTYSKMENTTD